MLLDKCFIIAELSANHGGDIEIAKETVRAAKRAGADAIKLQTYTADTITLDVRSDLFKIDQGTAWDGQYLHDLYKQASLPWEWHKELYDLAKEEGLVCFSSPFDFTAVDFLEKLQTPIYKVASFEITDIPLIEYIASKQKPIIISTGIATIEDIELAISACKKEGNNDITILKCTSAYPASPEDANLLTIPDIKEKFNVKVGLSDHTMGTEAPTVAVALGATVIEKHFILNKEIGGADAHFSLDEEEFTQMVNAVRLTERLMGKVDYEMNDKKQSSRTFSRSLFISEDVKKGDIITKHNIKSVRPNYGLHPKYYNDVLGKTFTTNAIKGTPLSLDIIK
ncbi:pseudaminic acid synthase [Pseudofulvibacter geojedonensis]|uniref:Pseudaminic acid synthase n=1 Tax=Pseudofulvibacter geojedonensis TaxID=1123758 RepID=A0ABW3HZQ3_9FLAO